MPSFLRRAVSVRAGFRPWMLLLLLAVVMPAGCRRTPDEQQVRQAISEAAAAARSNDAGGLLAWVSNDFVGNEGDLDRDGLRRMLALRAFRHDSTGILIGPVSIERLGDRMIATFSLTLTGGRSDSLLPNQADFFSMSTAWRHEGGRWRCYSATWKQGD